MEILRQLSLILISLSFLYLLYAVYCTRVFFNLGEDTPLHKGALPPVSVIKPVADMDVGDMVSLISFCEQDYPVFEVIFALPSDADRLIAQIETLKARFPETDIRWVSADTDRGPNYKVGNLIGAVGAARHPVLVISDADIRVGPAYLRQTVAAFLEDHVGLATCLYRVVDIRSVPDALQALSIQTDFIPNVLVGRKIEGITYGFGAGLCTSKEILEAIGGLEPLLGYLADDYQLGYRIHQKGYRIVLCRFLTDHASSIRNFRDHFRYRLRAGITQRVCRPLGYVASGITQTVSLSLLFLVIHPLSPTAAALFLFICCTRIGTARYLNGTVIRNPEITRYLWITPMNDLFNTGIWCLSLIIGTVHWRKRRFRVLKDGRMTEYPSSGSTIKRCECPEN